MAGDITKLGIVTEGRWNAEAIDAAYIIQSTITSVGTIGKGVSGGVLGSGDPVVTITNGTSFTLTSSSNLETSTFSWLIVKAA